MSRSQHDLAVLALGGAMLFTVTATARGQCVCGDLNSDGMATGLDIRCFTACLVSGSGGACPSCACADVNGDGNTNPADLPPFVNILLSGTTSSCTTLQLEPGPWESPPASPDSKISCGGPADGSDVYTTYFFSGEFYQTAEDLRIRGRGLDFVWARKYRSRFGPNTAMGNGWDFSYNIFIEHAGADLLLHDGNSRRDLYTLQSNGRWARDGFFREIQQNGDNTFTLMFADTGKWNFRPLDGSNAAGRISSIVDRNGNTLRFTYDSSGRLTTIHDTLDTAAHNRDINIAYNAGGLIESVTDFVGRQVRYAYYQDGEDGGSAGDLKSVRSPVVVGTPNGNDFPSGKTTIYTYSEDFADERLNHNLLTVANPRGQTYLVNTYSSAGADLDKLAAMQLGAAGQNISFAYIPQTPPGESGSNAIMKTAITDRNGNVKHFYYDAMNRPLVARELTRGLRPGERPFWETRWAYNADALPVLRTFADGASIEWTYDGSNPNRRSRGNLLVTRQLPGPLGGDQPNITESNTYETGFGGCGCGSNFVRTHTDGRSGVTTYTYDAAGNRLSRQGPGATGILEEWEYNAFGQPTARIHPDNGSNHRRRDEHTYYAQGPLAGYLMRTTEDVGGAALTETYDYNAVGELIRVVEQNGRDAMRFVNALGQTVRQVSRMVTDQSGPRYTRDFFYDASDNLVRIEVENRDHLGVVDSQNPSFATRYEYDALGQKTARIRELEEGTSITERYSYDANGNLAEILYGEAASGDQPGNRLQRVYDERDQILLETVAPGMPAAITTRFDYAARRSLERPLITAAIQAPGSSSLRITTSIYDGYGRLLNATDPMGNQVVIEHDANGNTARARRFGELTDVPGSTGNVLLNETLSTYDAANRLIRKDERFFNRATGQPIGDGARTTQWTYNALSLETSITNDAGGVTTLDYDTMNRLRCKTDPSGAETLHEYTNLSELQRTTRTEPSSLGSASLVFITQYGYDGDGRRISTTQPDGSIERVAYDSRNNPIWHRDARGNVRLETYDGAHRRTKQEWIMTDTGDGTGQEVDRITIARAYDDSGRVIRRTDDLGHVTTYDYDAADQLVRTRYADQTQVVYQYDAFGDRTRITDANGSVVTMTYDAKGRLAHRLIQVGQGVRPTTTQESYTYDSTGRIVNATNDLTGVQRAYDSHGNLTSETIDGRTSVWGYDADGELASATFPSARSYVLTHDGAGRLVSATGSSMTIEASYWGRGRLERLRFQGGQQGEDCAETRHAYDAGGRCSRVTTRGTPSCATLLDDRTLVWDAAGNRSGHEDVLPGGSGRRREFRYDSLNRLIGSRLVVPNSPTVNVSYQINGAHNRTQVTGGPDPGAYVANMVNAYTATPQTSRTYDANGNLLTSSGQNDNMTHAWDYANRVVESVDAAAGVTVRYEYDALGRRVRRLQTGPGASDIRFNYVGNAVSEFNNVQSGQIGTFLDAAGESRLLWRNNGFFALHTDSGRTVLSVTTAAGALAARYDYGDFGASIDLQAPTVVNPRRFSGLDSYDNSMTYLTIHRVYDPRVGTFLSRDPLGMWEDRFNLGNAYTYAAVNPWSMMDPTGLATKWCNSAGQNLEFDENGCDNDDEDEWESDVLCKTFNGADDVHTDIHNHNIDSSVEDWWDGCTGTVDDDEYDNIHDDVFEIEDAMRNQKLKIECEYGTQGSCNAGILAYVVVPTSNRVHLCDGFRSSTDISKRSTYYHELFHAYKDRTDKGYYTTGTYSFSGDCPLYDDPDLDTDEDKLRKNPDTYAEMAEWFNYFD